MSADNYYFIRPLPGGKFAATMGFASDEREPKLRDSDPRFDTFGEALDFANGEYTEYGVRWPEGTVIAGARPASHAPNP